MVKNNKNNKESIETLTNEMTALFHHLNNITVDAVRNDIDSKHLDFFLKEKTNEWTLNNVVHDYPEFSRYLTQLYDDENIYIPYIPIDYVPASAMDVTNAVNTLLETNTHRGVLETIEKKLSHPELDDFDILYHDLFENYSVDLEYAPILELESPHINLLILKEMGKDCLEHFSNNLKPILEESIKLENHQHNKPRMS